jgi:hypothetical protein
MYSKGTSKSAQYFVQNNMGTCNSSLVRNGKYFYPFGKMHNSVLSSHLGKKKTKDKLSQRFFWFEMREDINIWIQQCEICGAIKPPEKAYLNA